MVIAGVAVEENNLQKLKGLGVKDSKLLSESQRLRLAPLIRKITKECITISVPANKIDELRKQKNLNRIEAEKMAEIIKAIGADKAYVDAPQVSTEKFKSYLLALAKNHTEIISENYADKKYAVCSAASIIAKVERDAQIKEIKKIVGIDFGVGYSHDKRSVDFAKKCIKEKKFLEYIRHSWSTISGIKKKQKSLSEF